VIYRVPSKPSTLRVGIWKQTKELGGLPLQQSTYLLPDVPEVRLGLTQLQRQVEQGGGECTILEIPSLGTAQEQAFIQEFDRLRDEEYAEVAEDLGELVRHIDRKIARGRFDKDEVEDARGDLARAVALLGAIAARDYFGATRRDEVLKMSEDVTTKLDGYVAESSAQTGVALAAGEETGEDVAPEAVRVKVKTRGVFARDEAIERVRTVISEFEDGSLVVDGTRVEGFPDSAMLEVEYAERNGTRKLEIEFKW
jgi:amphi-Trp domain-containing protein